MNNKEQPALKVQVTKEYLDRMEEFWRSIEELVSLPMDDGANLPKWVHSIHNHLNKTIYSHLDVLRNETLDAYNMGVAIGAMRKMMHVLGDSFERLDKIKIEYDIPPELEERFQIISERVYDLILPQDDLRGLRVYAYGFMIEAFENWDWPKAKEFFKGITEGYGTVRTTEDNWVRARSNTEILIHMVWNWQLIENQIHNIPQLHNWLGKYFNRYQLGELKRLEKLCSRISLKFTKPGRPKGS